MPARFGKYVVESEIGRGGFGCVYAAFDADMNRRVAIKELNSESDPDLLSRFHAEAGTTASLTHKNIITVYDYAQQNGRPYLVMELLKGKTLLEIISSGNTLPLLEKLEIMYQVAEGLMYAHARGVIHRDIKPGNIMVLPDGDVKIMDFGIARLLGNTGARKTREGDLIGTVLYMAPECFRKYETDERTDIFAYGVLFYEFLTGEHPFNAENAVAIMNRIMTDEPVPVGGKVVGCPQSLDLLIQRLMMKDPETRFDDMADVLFETEPILRQLRGQRADALATEVARLFEQGEIEGLQPRVKQILTLDPGHTQGLIWQNKIRERMNRKRAEKLRQQGLEHMSGSRFREAAFCFEGALHLHPNKTEIVKLLQDANAELSRVKRSAQLVSDARAERQSGNLERAFASISEAIELDPANREAAQLRDSLQQQIQELQITARLSECRDLALEGRYDEATRVLDSLDPNVRNRTDITTVRTQILEEKQEADRQKRRAQFRQGMQTARQLLRDRDWEQAVRAADQLCSQFPDEPSGGEFREDVRRQFGLVQRAEALACLKESVQSFLQGKRFEEAAQAIAEVRERLGLEPTLEQLAEVVRCAAAEHQRSVVLQRVMQRTEELVAEDNLEGALELLRKAIGRFGEQAPFRAREVEIAGRLEERARADLRSRERERQRVVEPPAQERKVEKEPKKARSTEAPKQTRSEVIADGREKAAALARAGDLSAAVAKLQGLSKRYPNSSEIKRDLSAAVKELEYRRELQRRGELPGQKKGGVSGVVSLLKGFVSKERK
ncbi:MAG: hypothetical protein JWP08_826 [Bryobacterales bacterium]|nr:hypothetical protein [Bryobacterales bacterium]